MWTQEKILKMAFLIGAVTDAGALLPMLISPLAKLLWGFDDVSVASGAYKFAMGYGASLMLGWTVLLIWAYQKPMERKAVAAFTALVILGLVITEIAAVATGYLAAWRMMPTWFLQAILLMLFAGGFHYSKIRPCSKRMA
jgi:hypothetical protein